MRPRFRNRETRALPWLTQYITVVGGDAAEQFRVAAASWARSLLNWRENGLDVGLGGRDGDQIGLGKIAAIAGFFLGSLGSGDLGIFVPAAGLFGDLAESAAGFQEFLILPLGLVSQSLGSTAAEKLFMFLTSTMGVGMGPSGVWTWILMLASTRRLPSCMLQSETSR